MLTWNLDLNMSFNSKEKYQIYDTEKNSMLSSLMKITKRRNILI